MANRFLLTVRGLRGDTNRLQERLELIGREGVPNYFGAQRFGHGGGNLRALQAWWQEGAPTPSRTLRGILLSAARGFLFNAVLAERVRRGDWNRLLDGDRPNLDGTTRQFAATTAEEAELHARLARLDIHPTGPLWGHGDTQVSGEVLFLEQEILKQHDFLCAGLIREGLEHARRPLRVAVKDLRHALEGDQLTLEFGLTSGAYATAMLREVVDVDTLPMNAVPTNSDEEDGD